MNWEKIKRIFFIIIAIIIMAFLLWAAFFFVLAVIVAAGLIMIFEKLTGKPVFMKVRRVFVRRKEKGDEVIEAEYQIIDKEDRKTLD